MGNCRKQPLTSTPASRASSGRIGSYFSSGPFQLYSLFTKLVTTCVVREDVLPSPPGSGHSSSPPSRLPSKSASPDQASDRNDWDIQAHIKNLLTRKDMEHYVLYDLCKDLHQVGTRLGDCESAIERLFALADTQQLILNDHTSQIQGLLYYVDNIENRTHRNNIRVHGLPESIEPAEVTLPCNKFLHVS